MPKRKEVKKVDGVVYRKKVAHKFRIGTRKSGKSAHKMSNEELMAVTGKHKHKAIKVLALREAA